MTRFLMRTLGGSVRVQSFLRLTSDTVTSADMVGYETLVEFMVERGMYKLDGDLVDVGCFLGGGTVKLAEFAGHYGKNVYAIDIFDPNSDTTENIKGRKMSEIYQQRLKGRSQLEVFEEVTKGYTNIILVAKDSKEVKFSKEKKFLFGFIDGNHSPDYVTNDFYLIWNNLVSSGVVGCHDYKGDLPQNTRAIENLIEKHKNEIKEIVEIPSKWVVLLVKK